MIMNYLYHILKTIGKEPNTDLFPFMKGPSHQQTEEEMQFVFDSLGWNYSPLCGVKGLYGTFSYTRFQRFIKPL